METDFLVGGQPHVAVNGDYIRVAVVLKEKEGLGGEHPGSGEQGEAASLAMT